MLEAKATLVDDSVEQVVPHWADITLPDEAAGLQHDDRWQPIEYGSHSFFNDISARVWIAGGEVSIPIGQEPYYVALDKSDLIRYPSHLGSLGYTKYGTLYTYLNT